MWHKSCFTCGALSDLGCNRVLITPISPDYFHHFGCPFCHGCTNKIFLYGELHIFPSGSNSVTKKQSIRQIDGFNDVIIEEHYKAKQAYRDRVKAGAGYIEQNSNSNSNPNSSSKNTVSSLPIEAENSENSENDQITAMESEESLESLTPSCSIRFSDIYNYTEIEIQTRWKVLKKLENTDLDFIETEAMANAVSPLPPPPPLLPLLPLLPPLKSDENVSDVNSVLTNVFLRLKKLELLQIRENSEARTEYFNRFEVTVEADSRNDKFDKLRLIEEEKIEIRIRNDCQRKRKMEIFRLEKVEQNNLEKEKGKRLKFQSNSEKDKKRFSLNDFENSNDVSLFEKINDGVDEEVEEDVKNIMLNLDEVEVVVVKEVAVKVEKEEVKTEENCIISSKTIIHNQIIPDIISENFTVPAKNKKIIINENKDNFEHELTHYQTPFKNVLSRTKNLNTFSQNFPVVIRDDVNSPESIIEVSENSDSNFVSDVETEIETVNTENNSLCFSHNDLSLDEFDYREKIKYYNEIDEKEIIMEKIIEENENENESIINDLADNISLEKHIPHTSSPKNVPNNNDNSYSTFLRTASNSTETDQNLDGDYPSTLARMYELKEKKLKLSIIEYSENEKLKSLQNNENEEVEVGGSKNSNIIEKEHSEGQDNGPKNVPQTDEEFSTPTKLNKLSNFLSSNKKSTLSSNHYYSNDNDIMNSKVNENCNKNENKNEKNVLLPRLILSNSDQNISSESITNKTNITNNNDVDNNNDKDNSDCNTDNNNIDNNRRSGNNQTKGIFDSNDNELSSKPFTKGKMLSPRRISSLNKHGIASVSVDSEKILHSHSNSICLSQSLSHTYSQSHSLSRTHSYRESSLNSSMSYQDNSEDDGNTSNNCVWRNFESPEHSSEKEKRKERYSCYENDIEADDDDDEIFWASKEGSALKEKRNSNNLGRFISWRSTGQEEESKDENKYMVKNDGEHDNNEKNKEGSDNESENDDNENENENEGSDGDNEDDNKNENDDDNESELSILSGSIHDINDLFESENRYRNCDRDRGSGFHGGMMPPARSQRDSSKQQQVSPLHSTFPSPSLSPKRTSTSSSAANITDRLKPSRTETQIPPLQLLGPKLGSLGSIVPDKEIEQKLILVKDVLPPLYFPAASNRELASALNRSKNHSPLSSRLSADKEEQKIVIIKDVLPPLYFPAVTKRELASALERSGSLSPVPVNAPASFSLKVSPTSSSSSSSSSSISVPSSSLYPRVLTPNSGTVPVPAPISPRYPRDLTPNSVPVPILTPPILIPAKPFVEVLEDGIIDGEMLLLSSSTSFSSSISTTHRSNNISNKIDLDNDKDSDRIKEIKKIKDEKMEILSSHEIEILDDKKLSAPSSASSSSSSLFSSSTAYTTSTIRPGSSQLLSPSKICESASSASSLTRFSPLNSPEQRKQRQRYSTVPILDPLDITGIRAPSSSSSSSSSSSIPSPLLSSPLLGSSAGTSILLSAIFPVSPVKSPITITSHAANAKLLSYIQSNSAIKLLDDNCSDTDSPANSPGYTAHATHRNSTRTIRPFTDYSEINEINFMSYDIKPTVPTTTSFSTSISTSPPPPLTPCNPSSPSTHIYPSSSLPSHPTSSPPLSLPLDNTASSPPIILTYSRNEEPSSPILPKSKEPSPNKLKSIPPPILTSDLNMAERSFAPFFPTSSSSDVVYDQNVSTPVKNIPKNILSTPVETPISPLQSFLSLFIATEAPLPPPALPVPVPVPVPLSVPVPVAVPPSVPLFVIPPLASSSSFSSSSSSSSLLSSPSTVKPKLTPRRSDSHAAAVSAPAPSFPLPVPVPLTIPSYSPPPPPSVIASVPAVTATTPLDSFFSLFTSSPTPSPHPPSSPMPITTTTTPTAAVTSPLSSSLTGTTGCQSPRHTVNPTLAGHTSSPLVASKSPSSTLPTTTATTTSTSSSTSVPITSYPGTEPTHQSTSPEDSISDPRSSPRGGATGPTVITPLAMSSLQIDSLLSIFGTQIQSPTVDLLQHSFSPSRPSSPISSYGTLHAHSNSEELESLDSAFNLPRKSLTATVCAVPPPPRYKYSPPPVSQPLSNIVTSPTSYKVPALLSKISPPSSASTIGSSPSQSSNSILINTTGSTGMSTDLTDQFNQNTINLPKSSSPSQAISDPAPVSPFQSFLSMFVSSDPVPTTPRPSSSSTSAILSSASHNERSADLSNPLAHTPTSSSSSIPVPLSIPSYSPPPPASVPAVTATTPLDSFFSLFTSSPTPSPHPPSSPMPITTTPATAATPASPLPFPSSLSPSTPLSSPLPPSPTTASIPLSAATTTTTTDNPVSDNTTPTESYQHDTVPPLLPELSVRSSLFSYSAAPSTSTLSSTLPPLLVSPSFISLPSSQSSSSSSSPPISSSSSQPMSQPFSPLLSGSPLYEIQSTTSPVETPNPICCSLHINAPTSLPQLQVQRSSLPSAAASTTSFPPSFYLLSSNPPPPIITVSNNNDYDNTKYSPINDQITPHSSSSSLPSLPSLPLSSHMISPILNHNSDSPSTGSSFNSLDDDEDEDEDEDDDESDNQIIVPIIPDLNFPSNTFFSSVSSLSLTPPDTLSNTPSTTNTTSLCTTPLHFSTFSPSSSLQFNFNSENMKTHRHNTLSNQAMLQMALNDENKSLSELPISPKNGVCEEVAMKVQNLVKNIERKQMAMEDKRISTDSRKSSYTFKKDVVVVEKKIVSMPDQHETVLLKDKEKEILLKLDVEKNVFHDKNLGIASIKIKSENNSPNKKEMKLELDTVEVEIEKMNVNVTDVVKDGYEKLFFVKNESFDDNDGNSVNTSSTESTKCFSNLTERREMIKTERLQRWEDEKEKMKEKMKLKTPENFHEIENSRIFSSGFYNSDKKNNENMINKNVVLDDYNDVSFHNNLSEDLKLEKLNHENENENENHVEDMNELSFSTIRTNENEELNATYDGYSNLKNIYNENDISPISLVDNKVDDNDNNVIEEEIKNEKIENTIKNNQNNRLSIDSVNNNNSLFQNDNEDEDEEENKINLNYKSMRKSSVRKSTLRKSSSVRKSSVRKSILKTPRKSVGGKMIIPGLKQNSKDMFLLKKRKSYSKDQLINKDKKILKHGFGAILVKKMTTKVFSSFLSQTDQSSILPKHSLENGKIKLNFFEKPFDQNGIIHYISTHGMRKSYSNTHTSGI